MARQLQTPNWYQDVAVYAPGGVKPIDEFTIEQVWDGSTRGHQALRRAVTETVEGMRDRTRLQYIMWGPRMTGGVEVKAEDRRIVYVD